MRRTDGRQLSDILIDVISVLSFIVIIDAITQIVFATGVQELLEAYSLGWTFYCVIVLLVLTIVSLLPFWISTDEPCMYLSREIPF